MAQRAPSLGFDLGLGLDEGFDPDDDILIRQLTDGELSADDFSQLAVELLAPARQPSSAPLQQGSRNSGGPSTANNPQQQATPKFQGVPGSLPMPPTASQSGGTQAAQAAAAAQLAARQQQWASHNTGQQVSQLPQQSSIESMTQQTPPQMQQPAPQWPYRIAPNSAQPQTQQQFQPSQQIQPQPIQPQGGFQMQMPMPSPLPTSQERQGTQQLVIESDAVMHAAATHISKLYNHMLSQLPVSAQKRAQQHLLLRTSQVRASGVPLLQATMLVQQELLPMMQKAFARLKDLAQMAAMHALMGGGGGNPSGDLSMPNAGPAQPTTSTNTAGSGGGPPIMPTRSSGAMHMPAGVDMGHSNGSGAGTAAPMPPASAGFGAPAQRSGSDALHPTPFAAPHLQQPHHHQQQQQPAGMAHWNGPHQMGLGQSQHPSPMAGSGHMNSPFDFSFTAGTNGMQTSPTPFGQASAGLAQNGGSLPILPMSAPPAFANMPSHGSLPVRGSRRRSPPVQTPPASHGTPTFFQRSATTGYGAQRDGRGMTPPIGEMAQMNMAQSQQYNYVPPQDGEPMAKLRKSAIEEDVRAAAFAYGKAATAKQEADEAVQRYKWSSSLVAELMEDEKIDDAGLLGQETTYNVADYGSIDGSCTMCAFGSVEVGDKCPQCGRVAGAPSKTSAASGTQGQQMLAAAALRVAAGDAGLNNHGSGTSGQDAYGRSESGAESGTGNNSDGPGHGAHGGTALAATWVAVQEGFDAGLLLNGQQNARQL